MKRQLLFQGKILKLLGVSQGQPNSVVLSTDILWKHPLQTSFGLDGQMLPINTYNNGTLF